jgi:methylmalonyl-CoA/ethylmalonyl-CoA epimerase
MHDTPIRVDHVGIAVRDVAAAGTVLSALGCEKLTDREGPEGRFRWLYYRLGDASRIELVTPTGDEGAIAAFLDEHGPGLHHVTLEVADVDAVVAALEDAGVRVVDRADHDEYAEAFVSPRNPTGALFQLMEYHETPDGTTTNEMYIGGQPVETGGDESPPGS